MVLAVWGGVVGLRIHGVGRGGRRWHRDDVAGMREHAMAKIVPPSVARRGGSQAAQRAWGTLWRAIVADLHQGDLLREDEAARLLADEGASLSDGFKGSTAVANPEARRRLRFFARSLASTAMGAGGGALGACGLTVLIPHYSETILVAEEELHVKEGVT